MLSQLYFIGFTSLWVVATLLILLLACQLGSNNVYSLLILSLMTYFILWKLWDNYVDRRNKKIEESIVFPILDKKLNALAEKYPSICTVLKRRIVKEPVRNPCTTPRMKR